MKILAFKDSQAAWVISLPELVPILKRALRIQWREFVHRIEDAEDSDIQRIAANFATVIMFERAYKAS